MKSGSDLFQGYKMTEKQTIHTLKRLAAIAENLDSIGKADEAIIVDDVMMKLAQYLTAVQPTPDPRSQFNQQNQPTSVKFNDAIADYTGTNVMRAGGQNQFDGLIGVADGINQIVMSTGQFAYGGLQNLVGALTLPIEAVAELQSLYDHSLTDPLLGNLEGQQQTINMLVRALGDARRRNDTQKQEEIKKEIANAANSIKKSALQLSNMLKKRKASGQYTADTEGFQKTLDYSVQNGLTLRQMWDTAVKNRGGDKKAENYANNLIAKYRSIHGNVPDSGKVVQTQLK